MSVTQSLRIDVTHGFDISPGFVTVRIDGKTDDGKKEEVQEVKFKKLCDVLREEQPGKKISDNYRIALVQAILFNLKHGNSPNCAAKCDIYISEDNSTVNVPRPKGTESSLLTVLSATFKFILSKNMISDDIRSIANDFCELAKSGNFTNTKNALNHPLFWSAAQKIRYFKKCLVSEKEKGKSLLKVETMIGVNWIDKLRINDAEELENIRDKLRKKNDSLSVEDDTIRKLAEDRRWYHYREDSWKDFLAFFRNIHAHIGQQEDNVLCCFRNDDHDGYWDFFSKRFPGLFIKVYKEYGPPQNYHNGVEPKFLPDVYVQSAYSPKTNPRANLGKWSNKIVNRQRRCCR